MKYTVKIKENKDFVTLYKRGKYTAGKYITVYYRKNNKGVTRLGITTGKKVGNAVIRSRCRRVIRAAYRACENDFPKGLDYIIVARSECGEARSTDVEDFLRNKAIPAIKKSVNSNKTVKNNK